MLEIPFPNGAKVGDRVRIIQEGVISGRATKVFGQVRDAEGNLVDQGHISTIAEVLIFPQVAEVELKLSAHERSDEDMLQEIRCEVGGHVGLGTCIYCGDTLP